MSLRIVLIGYGYWGKNIARTLHEAGHLGGICEPDRSRRAGAGALYLGVPLYASMDEVLADSGVDAVAIGTFARTHAALTVQALEAGLDVFVEKPLALTYADGKRMVDTADRLGRILMVGHLLEYHPAVLALEELVRSGEIGRLQYVYSNRLNLGRFRREENALWSFAPHDIAVLLRLADAFPIEVAATGGAYLQPNVADVTMTNLLFDGGLRAHVFVSWLHPYKEQKLVVVGSEKMAVFDDRAPAGQKLLLYDQGATWVDNVPVPRSGDAVPVPCEGEQPLRVELDHFVEAIQTRMAPPTDGHSGLRVLQVLEAAQRSLQMGGSRVPLSQPAAPVLSL